MGVAYNSSIVTNGLVLCLDAANSKSYPGSGDIWTDLSGNGYNFTLVNGPTFNSLNGGGIEQDGADDYIERTYTTDLSFTGNVSFTLQIVAKNKTLFSNYPAIMSCGDANENGAWQVDLFNDGLFGGTYGTISFGRYQNGGSYLDAGGACSYLFTSTADANSTNFWCYTYSSTGGGKLYRNGNLITSTATTGSITRSTTPDVFIGRRFGNSARITSCIFYNISVYNKALTAAEIQQNYLATKSRYFS